MNVQGFRILAVVATGLFLGIFGPADVDLAPFVVGGVDCNASDHKNISCKQVDPKGADCTSNWNQASAGQACLDELSETKTVCKANNCENLLNQTVLNGNSGCTNKGCGG